MNTQTTLANFMGGFFYRPAIARITGDSDTALMISLLLHYWESPDYEIYISDTDWCEKTGLSKRQLEKARKTLIANGFITHHKGREYSGKDAYVLDSVLLATALLNLDGEV